jgi:hypothetical protein
LKIGSSASLRDKAIHPLAWWLVLACDTLPLVLVVAIIGGMLQQGFLEWRWVYFVISFGAVAATIYSMNNRS